MTRSTAAERLDDSFPHGTPAGFKDGCRGNGGCPNRSSNRMTCKEASLRYATDRAYRQAYDSGDIWLDRAEARDPEVDRVRESRARMIGAGERVTYDGPKTDFAASIAAVAPGVEEAAQASRSAQRGRATQQPAADLAPAVAQAPAKTTVLAEETRSTDVVDARVQRLEQQLADAQERQARAERLLLLASQDRTEAVEELTRLRAEVSTASARAAAAAVQPKAAFVEVQVVDGTMRFTAKALRKLADQISEHGA